MTASAKKLPERPATVEDFLAIPADERRHELIDGEIVEKAQPSGPHGAAQADVVTTFNHHFGRRGGGRPGGWWFATEVEILLPPGRILRPDVLGWRRERVPERPSETVVSTIPDWVCEILSSDRRRDLIQKKRLYHEAKIPHYWIVDPIEQTLFVHRWGPDGYVEVLAAERGDKVRAEPFDALEFSIGELFGVEDEASPSEPAG